MMHLRMWEAILGIGNIDKERFMFVDEVIKLCEHDMPVKFGNCHFCKNKINIDEELKKIHARNELTRRVDKLARWKEVAIEKHRESENKIERLIGFNKVLIERIEKLENLEKERAHLINYKSYLELADSIKELQEKSSKKPHKCPICNGAGKANHSLNGLLICKCHSCDGKGIVWG